MAKALCTRAEARSASHSADFEAIDRSILEIEKQVRGLDEIEKSTETIRSGSGKILDRVRIMREALGKQVLALGEKVGELKSHLADDNSA